MSKSNISIIAQDYRVTECGRVFSLGSNWRGYGEREMRQTLNSDGYPSVRLTYHGKRTRISEGRILNFSNQRIYRQLTMESLFA